DCQGKAEGWAPRGGVARGAALSRPAPPSRRSQLGIASGAPRASPAPGSGLGVARSATPTFDEERLFVASESSVFRARLAIRRGNKDSDLFISIAPCEIYQ